ncbi:hypothetical protein GGD56_005038 [Rhizobium mongolense]|uniref:Twin-arginine translocation signal domain-containing protein n=1 Tax=Rhizobium mongolense TaxID=57676 RepID=A0ABR6ITH1_9HYPH|nr:hypothetical protein [Rhizobium mongolense]
MIARRGFLKILGGSVAGVAALGGYAYEPGTSLAFVT